jgi:hypothetical protein
VPLPPFDSCYFRSKECRGPTEFPEGPCARTRRLHSIAFCDGDDWWIDRNKLQKQYELMSEKPEHFPLGTLVESLRPAKTKFIMERHCGRRARTLRIEELIQNNGGNVMTCTLFLKRDSLLALSDWLLNFPVGDYPIKIWVASQGGLLLHPGAYGRISDQNRDVVDQHIS